MSLFVLGGNIGWSIMPILAVPLVMKFGLSVTPVLVIPGIVVSILLYITVPSGNRHTVKTNYNLIRTVRNKPLPFLSLLGTVAFRSISFFGLVTFLPKFLIDNGYSPALSGMLLSALTFSGAIGGLIGGFLSDNWGRKPVIIGSLSLAVPPLFLFQIFNNWMVGFWLILAGAMLLASFSVTVVSAQEIFPDNKAVASSLALGFGLGLGGLGVGLIGHMASIIGLERTISFLGFLPLIAATFALGLPGRKSYNNL